MTNRTKFFTLLLFVLSQLAFRPNTLIAREKISINTNWLFLRSADTANKRCESWAKVNLPHSWNDKDVFDDKDGYYQGVGWYKHHLILEPRHKGKKLFLFFEGANQTADVYVNGKLAGSHIGGYTAFRVRIDPFISDSKTNIIEVKVDNSHNPDIAPLSADFTFFGGIYRDVYLEVTNESHFDMDDFGSQGVYISTPKVTAQQANVKIEGKFNNGLPKKQGFKVVANLYAPSGKLAHSVSKLYKSLPNKNNFLFEFAVQNPELYSPENPAVYKAIFDLTDEKGKVIDQITEPVGFRWFSVDADKGFSLNGKPLKLMGVNRHQDYIGYGNATPEAIHHRDMQLLKDMGANFIRIAHYPQDPAILNACDKLGILAWEEVSVVNEITESEAFTQSSMLQLTEMIKQHYNHPSVVWWGFMNEVLLAGKPKFKTTLDAYHKNLRLLTIKLDSAVHKLDPYRLSTIAQHGSDIYSKVGIDDITDVTGYNLYFGWYGRGKGGSHFDGLDTFVANWHAKYPKQPLFLSEFGSGYDPRVQSHNPNRFDFSGDWTLLFHQYYAKTILNTPYLLGGTMWNFVDFNSEGRIDAVPHVNNKGLLTLDRKPKDAYYLYQAFLTQKPMVHIALNHWTQMVGMADSGSNTTATRMVSVISNQPEVVLWLNGKLVAKKGPHDKIAVFEVPFVAGNNYLMARAGDAISYQTVNFDLLPNNLNNGFDKLYINVGSNCFLIDDKAQVVWHPDQKYTKGSFGYIDGKQFRIWSGYRIGTAEDIFGTEADPVYQTAMIGTSEYKIDAPQGRYEVTVYLAEVMTKKDLEEMVNNLSNGQTDEKLSPDFKRIFDVTVNGNPLIEDLCLEEQVGEFYAYSRKIVINTNSGISVKLKSKSGNSIINGISVVKL